MATLSEINAAEALRQFPLSVYLSLLAFIGLIGNSIVLYIYTKVYTNSNSRSFIRFLSAIDLMTCVVAVPVEIFTVLNQYEFDDALVCGISRFVNSAGTVSASTVLMLIAIDRYRKICKPLKWQISNKIANILSVCSIIFGVLFSIPNIYLYGARTREVVFENFVYNGTECSVRDALRGTPFALINNVISFVMFLVSSVTLVVLYSIIGKNVRFFAKRQEQRKNSSVVLETHSDAQGAVKRRISEMRSQDGASVDTVSQNQMTSLPVLQIPKERTLSKSSEPLVGTMEPEDSHPDVFRLEPEMESENPSRASKADLEVETGEFVGRIRDVPKIAINGQTPTNSKENLNDFTKRQGIRSTDVDSKFSSISRMSTLKMQLSSLIEPYQRKASRDMIQRNQSKKLAKSTTYLMFIISMVFILNFVPYLMLILIRELKDDFVDNLQKNDAARTAYRFFLRSYFANCAVNPIIYSIFDRRFRHACVQTLRSAVRKCCPPKSIRV